MTLLERFEALLEGGKETKTVAEEEEQLTEEEKRELEFARKEQMRRDLLGAGYGGIQRPEPRPWSLGRWNE